MFNKRGNSGSIPPNRLKTYGFPRTDFMMAILIFVALAVNCIQVITGNKKN